ncbi:MAG: glyceraldehyde 3-phosphate dehydrogenase NAD-binding domain-containing protein, partial [Sulfuricurvum sp.]
MALKIAINGFGRIGRSVTRLISERKEVELVAINDMVSIDMMMYLLQNDSVHGQFDAVSIIDEDYLQIGSQKVRIFCEKNPEDLNFGACGADVVLECSGLFLTDAATRHHISKGVKKVILSAPTQDTQIPTFVLGVNEHLYKGEDILS